ncbi:MAG: LysM peptidoglycan-binding domain-containing protein [Planctomycetota bacterium]|nr:LysM peptidoglycan-binding domain-containing protein [Planctomycetota bacterium]
MFDELAEAELLEKIAQLENLLKQKEARISELQSLIGSSTGNAKEDTETLAIELKARESELVFISKELTQREREVQQFKDLSSHLEEKLFAQSGKFEQAQIEWHQKAKDEIWKRQSQINDLDGHVARLSSAVSALQKREQELLQARDSVVAEYEARLEELATRNGNYSAAVARGEARVEQLEAMAEMLSEKERLLEDAYHEIERIRHEAQESSSRLSEQADQLVEMNQFLKTSQDEIARLNSDLRTVQSLSKQQRADFEFELNDERSRRKEIEAEYQKELDDIDKIVQFMQGQLEDATERGEQIEDLKKRLGEETSRNGSLKAEYQEQTALLEGHLEALRAQTGQADETGRQLMDIEARLQDEEARRFGLEREYTNQIADLEKQIDALKQLLSEAEASASQAESIRGQLSAEKEIHKGVEEEYLKQIGEIEALNDSLRLQLAELQAAGFDSSTIQQQLHESRASWESLEFDYQRKLEALEHQVESLQSRMEANTDEKQRADVLKRELDSAQARLKESNAIRETTQKEMKHLRAKIQTQMEELESKPISEEWQLDLDAHHAELQRVQAENVELIHLVETEKKEIELKKAKLLEFRDSSEKREAALKAESEEISRIHQEWMVVSTRHIAELEEKIQLRTEEVDRLQDRVDELENVETELELARATIQDLEKSLQQEERAIRDLVENNQRTLQELSNKHNAYESVRSQMGQLQASLRETEASNHGLQARTSVLEDELEYARLSIEKASADVRGAAISSTVESEEQQQEYEHSLGKAEAELAHSIQHAQALEQVLEDALAAHERVRLENEKFEQDLANAKTNFDEMARRDIQHREEIEELYFRLNETQLKSEQASRQFENALSNHEESNTELVGALQAKLDAEWSELQQRTLRLQEIEARHVQMAQQLNQLEAENAAFDLEIQGKQSEIVTLRNEVIPSLERERDMLLGELSHERKKTQKLSREHEIKETRLQEMQSRVLSAEEHALLVIAQVEEESRAAQNKLYQQVISFETQLEGSREELSRRELEVLESLEQQDALKEELDMVSERNESLGQMLDTQKEELIRLSQIELPEAFNERDRYRNERDDVSEELQRVYGEKEQKQEEVQRLAVALEDSSISIVGIEQRLQDKERDYTDQVEELDNTKRQLRLVREEKLVERNQMEAIRNRHIYVHAAAVALIAALGLYLIRQPQATPSQPGTFQELAKINDVTPLLPRPLVPVGDQREQPAELTAVGTSIGGSRVSDVPSEDSSESNPGPISSGSEVQEQNVAQLVSKKPVMTRGADIPDLEPYREPQQVAKAKDPGTTGQPAVKKPAEESRSMPNLSALAPAQGTEPGNAKKMYTIQKGESLWIICKRELGDPMLWKDVAKVNDLSVNDVKRLRPGNQINLSLNK